MAMPYDPDPHGDDYPRCDHCGGVITPCGGGLWWCERCDSDEDREEPEDGW